MGQVVETSSGAVEGTNQDGVSRFLGIPYAAAPFGPRRMRAPEPVEPWSGTRDATRFGRTVPKAPYPSPYDTLLIEPAFEGEECLNLNVWTPDVAGRAPVFVWIHGGAFMNGSGAVPQYDGTAFARDGVVCVTINYRLGADGFLDTGDDQTNLGLRDQIAALTWVKQNIAAFGGDPDAVTVGGESAGAMSVAHLLASPLARGLFHRAVLQSGAGHHAITRPTAQLVARELASRLGVETTRSALAQVPVADLLAAQSALAGEIQALPDPTRWAEVAANLMPFEPVVDGTVVPSLPVDALAAGASAEVAVLIGTNHDEQLLFLEPNGALGFIDENIVSMAAAGYGFADPEAAVALYAKESGDSPGHTMAALATDWFFRIPAIRLAEARGGGAPSYMYEFAWNSRARGGALRACHALELPFVFDTLASEGADWLTGPGAPQGLADEMHAAWVAFITTGDPGWAPYSSERRTVRVFDEQTRDAVDPDGERRAAWSGLR